MAELMRNIWIKSAIAGGEARRRRPGGKAVTGRRGPVDGMAGAGPREAGVPHGPRATACASVAREGCRRIRPRRRDRPGTSFVPPAGSRTLLRKEAADVNAVPAQVAEQYSRVSRSAPKRRAWPQSPRRCGLGPGVAVFAPDARGGRRPVPAAGAGSVPWRAGWIGRGERQAANPGARAGRAPQQTPRHGRPHPACRAGLPRTDGMTAPKPDGTPRGREPPWSATRTSRPLGRSPGAQHSPCAAMPRAARRPPQARASAARAGRGAGCRRAGSSAPRWACRGGPGPRTRPARRPRGGR